MRIKDIFAKPIDRDIKGVIKVGQDENENIRQELEEYVVTRELQKHFASFFSSYKRGITGTTDKMGVWISGFFGSGKSHFLKILSYLLSGKEVDGLRAIDYFKKDNKISDSMVIADMELAANTSTDVILFNIDSKSESSGKQSKDAIVSVFLKVFNEMQGFCGAYPYVADLERELTSKGLYADFKSEFERINGGEWDEERYAIDFIQDDIVEALSAVGFMSAEAARNWCEKATEPYSISIERFAALVKKYVDSKGANHHVVFLVDEIGQYIGDDSKLMLNLQTVTEDLGTACGGKVWVIVTSQQDIDSITKTKGNDFSKIQGRFDTRLSLSSANVDEVIRKRVLRKNKAGRDALALLYDEKETTIKNLVSFNDGIEKKLYADRDNFAEVYPFIPYQFNLLGSVLTAIRTFGASGKHLADGERSMLALFKESAVRLMNDEPGTLVPFNMFYEPLEEFIDHSHRGVIIKALDNDYLNPNHERDCFDVDVLKTLFMIKYVKEIRANVDNITSLMVSHIDEGRMELRERVEDALKRLIRQTLVQKSGDTYVFLTNEEQEINRAIGKQSVEGAEITSKISEMIFDGIYAEKKYRCSELGGRYSYSFNQIVDDRQYKANRNYDLTLKILTPDSDEISGWEDDALLRMISGQTQSVLVVLPDDRTFIDEIRMSLQIEKYLRYDAAKTLTKYEQIKSDKKAELREHMDNAAMFLKEAMKAAKIYVNGDLIRTTVKEIVPRINEAMGKLVSIVYYKLSYIDTAVSESDIKAVFNTNSNQLTLEPDKGSVNRLALNDVNDYIASYSARHIKVSMKTLTERFTGAPYGFLETDVQWLAAKLFKDGNIAFYVNNEPVTLVSKKADEVIRYITRKEYLEKLLMERREKADAKQKKTVRTAAKELFRVTLSSDDDDVMMKSFMGYAQSLRDRLDRLEARYAEHPEYPGKAVVESGRKLMNELLQMRYPAEFFAAVNRNEDALLDFAEDFDYVNNFFKTDQVKYFDRALDMLKIYNESKTFIVSETVERAVADIEKILRMPSPYGNIYELPMYIDDFRNIYTAVLVKHQVPTEQAIREARSRVYKELEGSKCGKKLIGSVRKRFDELEEKARHCNNVATMQNIRLEADVLKLRCLNEIADEERLLAEQGKADDDSGRQEAQEPPKKVKKQRSVSIRSLTAETTWQIETEADVKRYVSQLEKRLIESLEDGVVVNVEI